MAQRLSVSISLPPDMVADLRAEAIKRDLSLSQLIRERIRAGEPKG